jgi:hypothetical protein
LKTLGHYFVEWWSFLSRWSWLRLRRKDRHFRFSDDLDRRLGDRLYMDFRG